MTLNEQIGADITAAMRAKDATTLSALRMLKTAIVNKSVEKKSDLNDAEVLQVVASLVKQRRDSIEQFTNAGRTDLVAKENGDLAVLERYLPPAATAEEIEAAVAAAIIESGATTPKDMGKVMKAVIPKLAGKNADGKAGRTDLVDKETGEIKVLEHYLPPAASAEEIDAAVAAAIAESGATSPKDMGKVMKAVMPKLAGKNADGKTINDVVRRKLGAA